MSNQTKCKYCVWGHQCKWNSRKACPDFYPIVDDDRLDMVDKMVEDDRYEYRAAWLTYISDFEG